MPVPVPTLNVALDAPFRLNSILFKRAAIPSVFDRASIEAVFVNVTPDVVLLTHCDAELKAHVVPS